ncbi:hypothetical protein B0H21DRAFT_724540 [Amylocystis lapponica]|nr:hypothetical protein B0H21DRAFT_724540 [Amylocystis lapponica]
MADTTTSTLQELIEKLDVSPDFARYENITEPDIIVRLENWRRRACTVLSELRHYVEQRQLSLQEKSQVVSAVAPFDGEGPWTLETTREQARVCLGTLCSPDIPLLEHILTNQVKPNFLSNPHPQLSASTGRTLPRPAGGPHASLDHFQGQLWKTRPGIANLISWCVRRMETTSYERLWHLIIPPVMTLLDDYEAQYKLQGIQIVSEMLQNVPADLLRRTGVDTLLFSSLKNCLAFLHNPETPNLIRATVPATIALVLLTTHAKSAARFDQLCALLGDGLIGSVWIYASGDPDTLEASLDVLPEAVTALDIGTARYLKALVPQLVLPLASAPEKMFSAPLMRASLRALTVVIKACAPRMHIWKGTILEGVIKCWVTLADSGADGEDTRELKDALKEVCDCLSDACPSVVKVEYVRMLQVDADMFSPLLQCDGRPG